MLTLSVQRYCASAITKSEMVVDGYPRRPLADDVGDCIEDELDLEALVTVEEEFEDIMEVERRIENYSF